MRPREMPIDEVFQQYLEWHEGKRSTQEMLNLFEDLGKQKRGTFFYPWWKRVRDNKPTGKKIEMYWSQ